MLADVMNGENVRMIQCGHCPRLLLKAAQAIRFRGERTGKNFQRDFASQACVLCAIHLAHAARAERRLDLVGTKFGTRG